MATQQQERSFGSDFAQLVIEWVGDNCAPEEVFAEKVLEEWAKDNGWVKVDDLPDEVRELL